MGGRSLRRVGYFRLLLVATFEGNRLGTLTSLGAQRLLAVRAFLRLPLTTAPDRHDFPDAAHYRLYSPARLHWVQHRLWRQDCSVQTTRFDATHSRANAAMRSIVAPLTPGELSGVLDAVSRSLGARRPRTRTWSLDRNRKNKTSNEIGNSVDPDANIAKMKDCRPPGLQSRLGWTWRPAPCRVTRAGNADRRYHDDHR